MSKRKQTQKKETVSGSGQVHETHVHNLDECEDHESCRQLLSTLGDYVDGTLSSKLCSELETHMKDCKRCRVVVNTMKKTVELYQETSEETHLPDDARERLFLRLNLEDYLK
jgi:anti-sigma factor RsiW